MLSKHVVLGEQIRYLFYKRHLISLGENVKFSYGVVLSSSQITIGNNVRFGINSTIANCSFGNNIHVAQDCHFLSGKNQHSHEKIGKKTGLRTISLGDNIWIGCGSIVMADILNDVVVGAGSVVVKTVDNNEVIAGVPAKGIK